MFKNFCLTAAPLHFSFSYKCIHTQGNPFSYSSLNAPGHYMSGSRNHTYCCSWVLTTIGKQGSIYWGDGGKLLPLNVSAFQSPPPPPLNASALNYKLFQILILFDDDIKESVMSRNAISANPEHYLFKLFRGSMPSDPPRRPKKFFFLCCVAPKFFLGSTSPQTKNPR